MGAAPKDGAARFSIIGIGAPPGAGAAIMGIGAAVGADIGKARAIALKGGSEAVTLTAGGHVRMGTGTWSAVAAPHGAGKLRVLGVAGDKR